MPRPGEQRILLVHLISSGDCLMATTVARQIKADFPGCHLTWAIGHKCRQIIDNNPDVDQIWTVEYAAHELPYDDVWRKTKQQAEQRKASGEFDRIFYTQIFPENFNNFDGTTRSTIFRSYPGRITVPIAPVIRLYEHETERVKAFAVSHDLGRYENVVIFECAPASGQSPLTPELAVSVSRRIVSRRTDTAFIISSHLRFDSDDPRVIDGSVLSYRENVELFRYGSLLLGGSSGLTWLMTSESAKRLPTIQFLKADGPWYSFASVKYDHRFFGLSTDHILETDLAGADDVAGLVNRYLDQKSFAGLPAREFRPSIGQVDAWYDDMVRRHGLQQPVDARRVLRNFADRNPEVRVDVPAFYARLARRVLRRMAGRLLRKAKRVALGRLGLSG